jgi:NDP-sugar pyrophosphorylase family protein
VSAISPLSEITVAILAGGLGTRLRAVVGEHPKVLAEVNGRPFLTLLLRRLESFGFRRVVLCTGYKTDEVEYAIGRRFGELSIVYSRERDPLGTGGALRQALPFLQSERVLAMNGDSFCEVDLEGLCASHAARKAGASLALAWVDDRSRFGQVQISETGQITAFTEKSGAGGGGWINAGIYLIERKLIQLLPANLTLSLEREVLPMWIAQGVYGFKAQGRFLDIGTPESYALAQIESFFESRAAESVLA